MKVGANWPPPHDTERRFTFRVIRLPRSPGQVSRQASQASPNTSRPDDAAESIGRASTDAPSGRTPPSPWTKKKPVASVSQPTPLRAGHRSEVSREEWEVRPPAIIGVVRRRTRRNSAEQTQSPERRDATIEKNQTLAALRSRRGAANESIEDTGRTRLVGREQLSSMDLRLSFTYPLESL